MATAIPGVVTSPVHMEDRKSLGIKPGDTVRVHQKIVDKGKTRIQVFEGLVLARKHGSEPGATFTVRKVSSGIGVEKIFPLYSPLIDKIEIVKRAKVRRAKLYYIREKVARQIKRQMRRMSLVSLATESDAEVAARMEAEAKAAEEAAAQAEAEALKAEEEKVAAEAAPETEAAATAEAAPTTEAEAVPVAGTPEVTEEPTVETTEEAVSAPEIEEEKKG